MCNSGHKHWLVNTEIKDGYTIQTCTECGKQVVVPGNIQGVMDFLKRDAKYSKNLEYINKYYSRVI